MITTEQIRDLRDKTGISVMQCKKALERAQGDPERALAFLKEEGARVAEKKSGRTSNAGTVQAYVHGGGEIGVLLALNCETDFVSGNEEFKRLAYDIAMHVAAMDPPDVKTLRGQEFVKDPSKTIDDLLTEATQKFGERTVIGEFSRLSIGGR